MAGALVFRWLVGPQVQEAADVPLGFATRAALVAAILLGYALAATRYGVVTSYRDLQGFGLEDQEVDAEHPERSLFSLSPAGLLRSRLAGLAGVLFFVVTVEVPNLIAGFPLFRAWLSLHTMTYMLALGVTFFWVAGRSAYFTLSLWEKPAWERLEIDLLDLHATKVIGRIAARSSLLWILALSIGSLVFLNPELGIRSSLIVFLPIMGITLGIAAITLVAPVRSTASAIRSAKQAELERIDAAIRGDRSGLADSRIADRAAELSLADLIAYRGLVDSISEWPFDAPTLTRFALYLLIPLVSWVGGALVERGLSLFLD